MLSKCIILAVLGCAVAVPVAQYQSQQAGGIPPHLLRQYIGHQQQQQQEGSPRPAPARLPYTAQSEPQYQPQYQAQAQPQPQQQQQYRPQYQAPRPQEPREPEEYDANPSYQFGFDVNDDQFTNYQNRKEQRDGDVIKGSYSVVDSDGFIRTVTYTADPKEGFKAEVSRMPTDIVVKVPTPKPQTLQTVAHAPAQQSRPQQYAQPAQQYTQPAQQYSQPAQQYSQPAQQYAQAPQQKYAQQPQQYYSYEQ